MSKNLAHNMFKFFELFLCYMKLYRVLSLYSIRKVPVCCVFPSILFISSISGYSEIFSNVSDYVI